MQIVVVHYAYPTRFVNAPRMLPLAGTPAKQISHWLLANRSKVVPERCKQNKKFSLLDPTPSFGQLCSYWSRADRNLFKNHNLKTKGCNLINLYISINRYLI
jgi:hypothetical protein